VKLTVLFCNEKYLPALVAKDANNRTKYMNDASGSKLRTQVYENGLLKTTTDYCGAFVYENKQLQYIQTAEGRIAYFYTGAAQITKIAVQPTVTSRFEYFLTDHLGNTRVVFTKGATGAAETVQEDHYYPFGLQLSGQGYTNTSLLNKYLFNGKEKQDQTGMYDYGFRQLDPVLGRWFCVDRLAESTPSESPYCYAGNDPVNQIDVMGLYHGVDFSNFMGGSRVQGGGFGDGGGGGGMEGRGGGGGFCSPIFLNMCMGPSGGPSDAYVDDYIAAQNNSTAPFKGTYGEYVQMRTNPGTLGDTYVPYYQTSTVGAGGGGSFDLYGESSTTRFAGWKKADGRLPFNKQFAEAFINMNSATLKENSASIYP
jgi:RHS repeat-associated protein